MRAPIPMIYVQSDIPAGQTIAEHRRVTFPPKRHRRTLGAILRNHRTI